MAETLPLQLKIAIQIFSFISLLFEGYEQSAMGGINASPTYVTLVGIGKHDGTITDTTRRGDIVSVYIVLGVHFRSFVGGWLADRIGRVDDLLAGSLFALVGALQSAAQNLR